MSETYDRYGNRTAQSVTAGSGPSNSVTVSATTNRITTTGYAYDANGNMTNDGANTLVFDGENNNMSASNGGASGTYTFDGHGYRVKRVSGSTTTVSIFSGSQVIAEYLNGAAPSSPANEYVYSGSQKIAIFQSGSTYYFHYDHLSPRFRTDTSGSRRDDRGTYPFGENWYSPAGKPLMYTTYYRDSETGSDYALARFNVSRLGRFSSPDRLAGEIQDPQSLNRFAYSLNDPSNMTDPLGLCTFNITIGNTGLLGDKQLKNAEDQFNKILSAGGSGLNAVFNQGEADFTATLSNDGRPGQYGENDQSEISALLFGASHIANSAHVFVNSIESVSKTANVDPGTAVGRVISHEFGHWGLKVYDNYADPTENNQGIMEPRDRSVITPFNDSFNKDVSIPLLQKLCDKRHPTKKPDPLSAFGFGAFGYFFELTGYGQEGNTFSYWVWMPGSGGGGSPSRFPGGVLVGLDNVY